MQDGLQEVGTTVLHMCEQKLRSTALGMGRLWAVADWDMSGTVLLMLALWKDVKTGGRGWQMWAVHRQADVGSTQISVSHTQLISLLLHSCRETLLQAVSVHCSLVVE